jgi:D-arginine dehydrogenase
MGLQYDVVVIGGGISGASVAANLSADRSVLLVEMEEQLGYHSTGRSAALFILSYGNSDVRALTRASRDFFYQPPLDFSAGALVKPRSLLVVAGHGGAVELDEMLANLVLGDRFERKTVAEAMALCPILKPDALSSAAFSDLLADIEVHELQQGYIRTLRRNGGVVLSNARVGGLQRSGGAWRIETTKDEVIAQIVVNAAGAWAGEIARLAGAQDVGLKPLRRTVCLFEPPAGSDHERWPMLSDASDQFYLKPEAGMLLLSPSDETPSVPTDAQAEELDVAIAIDRIEQATSLSVKRVTHKWAGLRSFVKGRSPVIGFDAVQPGFFWQAAFGGFGIQTAPAASSLAASLILDRPLDGALVDANVDLAGISPRRFVSEPV